MNNKPITKEPITPEEKKAKAYSKRILAELEAREPDEEDTMGLLLDDYDWNGETV